MVANWTISAMNTRLIHAVAAGITVLLSSAAHADWQFTKWGMTPDQVVAASGGKAAVLPAKNHVSSQGLRVVAAMPWESETLHFQVGFMFDGKNALRRVSMLLKSGGTAADLLRALKAKYGPPDQQMSEAGAVYAHWYRADDINFLAVASSRTIAVDYEAHGYSRTLSNPADQRL
jgi:hypothetical protein